MFRPTSPRLTDDCNCFNIDICSEADDLSCKKDDFNAGFESDILFNVCCSSQSRASLAISFNVETAPNTKHTNKMVQNKTNKKRL